MFTIFKEGLGTTGALGTVKDLGLDKLSKFFSSFTGSATLGIATFFAMKKAIEALSDAYNLSYDSAIKNTEANVNNFKSTKTEIEGLESNVQQYKDTLSSLGEKYEVDLSGIESVDDMITKLRQSGKLELTDEIELQRIDSQNASLERQLAIKNKLIESQQKLAAADAKDTLGRGEQSVAQQVAQYVPGGKKTYQGMVNNVNIVDAVNENVAAIQEYENAITDAENAMQGLDPNSKAWKEQEENINSYNEAIEKLTSDLNTKEADLSTLLSALSVDGEGLVALEGYENEFNAVRDAINNLNNMSLTPLQQEYAKIESFFDGSDSKNSIKEKLQEATNEGKNLEDVLAEMGLTLSDLGIENIDTLSSYFKKTAEEAEEAKKTVQDYATTVADVVAAGETVNQDDSWTNFSEAYKTANELLKEGKTGVDDFQSVAALLNPAKVKELAEKGGKYTADAYEEAFREVKEIADRWFSEDETKSMENFVNDFKKAGLFDVDIDDKGLWDIETKFKSTAEAAKEYGISVEAVETMLQGLSAYGYEFDEVLFSGDALDRYQENLTKIKALYESMGEGSSKDVLGEMIGNWDSELEKYKEDLDSLSEPQIVQIEFQYDLTQIEADLEKIKNKQESGAELGRTDYAEWINTYDSKYAKQKEGFGLDEVEIKAVTISDDAVEKAREELAKAVESGDETDIIEAQVKLIAAQESRDALLESFNKWNLEQEVPITADSNIDEVTAAWNKFTSTPQVVKLEGKITNADTVESTLESLAVGSTIVYTADVDGVTTEITAIKNQDGSVTYTAEIDNMLQTLAERKNTDGTVSYTPITREIDKYNYDQDGTVFYTGNFPSKAPTIYGHARYTVTYRNDGTLPSENIRDYHTGTMFSPARKDGTAYNVLNTLPLSAYASGRVGLPRDERALVNEEYINGHSESIVRDGVWRLIPGGAHLENLKQGDLIFSAQQTEDLLRSGKTPGHARAFAQGNVLASAYRLGNNTGGSSGKNSKDNKTKSSTTENQPEKFDWVERKILKVQRAIEKLDKIANSTYKTWTARNEALTKEISKVNDEIEIQEKAYREYIKEANSVGLDKKYRDLVRDGKIDIQTIKNDKLKEKIQEYQEWIDKARDCKDAIAELEETEASLYQQRFDNVASKYDSILERYDYRQSMHEELIAQNEAKGQPVSGRYYQSMIYAEEDRLEQLKKEREELYEAFEKGMDADGNPIKRGSEAWREMLNTINETTVEIEKSETAILEFEKTIRELDWANFDLLQERISNVTAESDFLIKVMSDEKMHDEKGNLTDEGLATMGLHAQNYETYLLQAERYAKEIARLDKDIAKNPYNQDLINRRQELLGLQRDSILASEDEKAAIIDMVQSGIDLEIEALQDVIDKQKERLDSAKDLYDYQKKINNLTKEHSSIQKQILAYSGDDSEENRARLQQLQVKLEESQENLRDAEYEKYLSDHKELLDSLQTEYTDVLNERMDNIDALFSEMLDKVDTNRSDILRTLTEQASGVGTTISDSISDVWMNEKTVIAGLQTTVNTISVDLKNMLDSLLFDARTDAQQVSDENAFNSYEAGLGATTFNYVSIVDDKKGKVEKVSSKNEINDILSDSKIKQIKKINGYATGAKRIDEDQLAWLNENGNLESIIRQRDGAILRPLSEGDRVLNATTTEKLYNLALDPTKYFAENIGIDRLLSSISSVRNNGESVNNINVDLTINAPNVTDTETLIYEIKHNKEIERTFLAMTTDRMIGKSHLRKY